MVCVTPGTECGKCVLEEEAAGPPKDRTLCGKRENQLQMDAACAAR